MHIPTQEMCYRLIRKMAMPDHIICHSLQVCRVALVLVRELAGQGISLNWQLVQASALLHDITKARSFKTGERHTDTGHELLVTLGYPEVGDIIRQHVKLDIYSENGALAEANIVNYADKRVLHDRITSLDKRMEYILSRYGTTAEYRTRLRWLWDASVEQEKKIFTNLSFSPSGVEDRMENFDMPMQLLAIKSAPLKIDAEQP
jgi:putative nucleotidyltransferase with HDIG domain